jgi:hypothetical protein
MLFRVSCKTCRLSSIWTDEPSSFLETVCLRYRHCEARIEEEVFRVRLGPRQAPQREKHREESLKSPVQPAAPRAL